MKKKLEEKIRSVVENINTKKLKVFLILFINSVHSDIELGY